MLFFLITANSENTSIYCYVKVWLSPVLFPHTSLQAAAGRHRQALRAADALSTSPGSVPKLPARTLGCSRSDHPVCPPLCGGLGVSLPASCARAQSPIYWQLWRTLSLLWLAPPLCGMESHSWLSSSSQWLLRNIKMLSAAAASVKIPQVKENHSRFKR